MGRSSSGRGGGAAGAATWWCVGVLLVLSAVVEGGIPANKPLKTVSLSDPELKTYFISVVKATGGMGIGIAVFFGIIMTIVCLGACLRCCRIRRRDRAVAEGSFPGDKEFPQADLAFQMIGAKNAKQKRVLWAASLALVIAYVACGGSAYSAALNTKATLDKAYDRTDVFLTDVQKAICEVGGDPQCEAGSLGDFLGTVEVTMTDTFDAGVSWIGTLSSVQVPFGDIGTHMTAMSDAQAVEEASLPIIKAAAADFAPVFTNPDYTMYNLATFAVPAVTSADETQLVANGVAIATTSTSVDDADTLAYDTMAAPTSPLMALSYTIDGTDGNEINGDANLRGTATEAVDSTKAFMLDLTVQVFSFQNDQALVMKEKVSQHFGTAVLVVSGIVLLPGLVLLACIMCAAVCKSPKPVYLSMTFSYWTQGLYCVVGGLALLLFKINSDMCKQHVELMEVNWVATYEIRGVTSVPIGTAAPALSQCDSVYPYTPTPTNNLVDIMGIKAAFDMSGTLGVASDSVRKQEPAIRAIAVAGDAITVAMAFVLPDAFDAVPNGYVHATALANLNAAVAPLPPEPWDRDDAAQSAKFETVYLVGQGAGFTWADYTTSRDTYSATLQEMVGNGYDPAPLTPPLDFTEIADVTTIDKGTKCVYFAANPGYFTTTTPAAACTQVTDLYDKTVTVNDFATKNTNFRTDIATLLVQSATMNTNLALMTDAKASMVAAMAGVDAGVADLDARVDTAATQLVGLADTIIGVNDVFLTADRYSMCGFVGSYFADVYEGEVCGSFQKNLRDLAAPVITVACLMVLAFTAHACLAPALRTRPEPTPFIDTKGGKLRPLSYKSTGSGANGDAAAKRDAAAAIPSAASTGEVVLVMRPQSWAGPDSPAKGSPPGNEWGSPGSPASEHRRRHRHRHEHRHERRGGEGRRRLSGEATSHHGVPGEDAVTPPMSPVAVPSAPEVVQGSPAPLLGRSGTKGAQER